MASNLLFDIIANDKASAVVKQVGDTVSGQSDKWASWKNAGTIATAAVGAAAIKFGMDSVDAYAEAESSHMQLEDAYERFPALADVNIAKLDELNAALQRKTGFDDDETAAAQATLAQFGLTGQQLEQLTPLMQDFAAKTGVDLPTAADQLGKAMLGQGKALKAVGIDFADAGSVGANFDEVVAGLTTQVGGFAENGVSEASRKSKILRSDFGDLQEKAGAQLLPAITSLTSAGVSAVEWMSDHETATKALVITFGTLTAAVALAAQWTAISTTATTLAAAGKAVWTGVTTAATAATGLGTAAQSAWNASVGVGTSTLVAFVGSKATELGAWVSSTAAKATSTAATVASTAAQWASNTATSIGSSTLVTFVGSKALELGAWVSSTAAKVAGTAATVASTAATGLATAAQWAWNAALSANPIGLIIIAVAALVAGIVLLWQNNEGFRNWVIGAWDAIKGAFVAVWDWVSQNWPLLLEILTGPIGIAVVQIVQHWDSIKAAGAAAWQWIKDAWSSAGDFFSGVGQGIEEAFKMPFRAVATAWNNTVGQLSWTVPDWIPLIGGKTLTVPKIPMLADGGTALRAGLAIVGEAGPELISMPVGATVSPLNGRPSAGDSGVMRLHPDDMAVLAELVGEHVLAGARQVSSSTVTAAFRTATRGR